MKQAVINSHGMVTIYKSCIFSLILLIYFFRFPVENLLNRDSKLILRPNLKPGETGNYRILDFLRK